MDIMETLRKLYALAVHEGTNIDEARTAAYALLKKARENGVAVVFRKSRTGPTTSADGTTSPPRSPPRSPFGGFDFETLMQELARAEYERMMREREEMRRRAPPPPPRPRCVDCGAVPESTERDRCDACVSRHFEECLERDRRPAAARDGAPPPRTYEAESFFINGERFDARAGTFTFRDRVHRPQKR
jgi:hypothetical protein